MRKINLPNITLYISMILFIIVALLRVYLANINGMTATFLVFLSNILLVLYFLMVKKFHKKRLLFIILCIFCLLPSFYNNAYLSDELYNNVFIYILTLSYCILLYFSKLEEKQISFAFNIIAIFAVLTSIVTWISFISPNFYIKNIISLLPTSRQLSVIHDFSVSGMRMGLTDHYSRNAFYILIGILILIKKYINNKEKKSLLLIIIFLFGSLFLIGKRAHLIFLLISLILGYFIYNKVSIKNILKFMGISFIFGIIAIGCINVIPGTQNIVNRLLNVGDVDFTSGRADLYSKAWQLYLANDSEPLGWGQFAKSTGYSFVGVHNDYIQLYCETGIIGFILIVGSNLLMLKNSINMCRLKKGGLTFIILVYNIFFLVYSLTGIPHYDIEVYMIYFLLNCVLFNLKEEIKWQKKKLA